MTVGKTRDLRLVRDAQHLIRLRQLLEFNPNSFTHTPADTRVDLIEHNRSWKLRSIRYSLQHQHQT
jgi:hypothetical protein